MEFHPFAALAMSLVILSTWLPVKPLTKTVIAGLFVAGLFGFGYLQLTAIVAIAVLGALAFAANRPSPAWLKWIWVILWFLLAAAMMLHWIPGFHNMLVVEDQVMKAGSLPFSLNWNFDKPFVGWTLLVFCSLVLINPKALIKQAHWGLLILLIGNSLLIGLALASGIVRWDPQWVNITWIFLANNLLMTCVAEEVVFRGVLQSYLSKKFGQWIGAQSAPETSKLIPSKGDLFALCLTSLVFGLVHFAGGPGLIVFATIAGLVYGYAYWKTQSLEWAILAHFSLNALHFVFFSYPMLA